ncbi:MAG: S9 family peptidase [Candidatus Acidiferrales bacterium]
MHVTVLLSIFGFACAAAGRGSRSAGELPADVGPAPVANKLSKAITVHGNIRVDDYFWLREKQNPKVMEYLKAEEAYSDAAMKPLDGLQDTLFKEMVDHIKETDQSAPYRRGDCYYYSRTEQGKQYSIICRRKGTLSAPEEVILDLNELATGHSFMSIGSFQPSDDGNLLAYTTDNVGYRQYTLHVKDLRTGKLLSDHAERVDSVVWAADNKTILYVTEDAVTKRKNKCFRHGLGASEPELVFEEPDELFDIAASRTRDRKFILFEVASKTSTEIHYVSAYEPLSSPVVIESREPDHEYDVEHAGNLFYIRTNKGATNFRVVTAPDDDPCESNWKELIAHRPEVKIAAIEPFARHLVLAEWECGLQQIEIIELETRQRHRIPFPEPVYAASVADNYVFDTTAVRYNYQSLTTPSSAIDYEMNTQKATLVKQTEVPGGFDRANYVSERVFATASDDTKVPISLVYRKGVTRDGTAPLLLYAYGSYGISIPPTFSSSRLTLLDRGVVFAIAHVRGGGELGEPWRDAGRMMKKMNTFTDFIACAEYLEKEKYTSKEQLVIQGGSAGGMLVGAVVNMRPDLFKAAIAQVPFMDVLNDMLDASLPLTTSEYIEWGNPNEEAAYNYMAGYSPYDNVKRQAYPAMLVKTSLNDSQVPYWGAAKFVAKLRDMKTDQNPLLLKVNLGAGHGGASGRYDALREAAFNFAFVLWQVGIAQQGTLPS